MNSRWILIGIGAAVGVGVLVAVGVLWAYGYYLGPVSRQATDWGSFGSVMSGAFTLLSSFATIGTLLFLYLQQLKNDERQQAQDIESRAKQEKHDEVVERQLAALTFEQYLNHRKLFIERLQEQAVFFNNVIAFSNPERVYNTVFAKNNPSNCDYVVYIESPDKAKPHDLTDCMAIYNSISSLLENYRDKEKHLDLIQKIFHLQGCLGFAYVGPNREGDIYFLGHHTGINIYCIQESISRIEYVLNSILFYTGNDEAPTITHKASTGLLRDALYDTLTHYHRAKGAIEIRYTIAALPHFHKIYEASQQHFIVTERILEEAFVRLSTLFSDHSEIEKLKDFEYADHLTDVIHFEIKRRKEQYKSDPSAVAILEIIERDHWAAMEELGVTE
ncbi:hypothetical protein [Pseudomonas sp. NBRC 111144]|uniref:hypothetical protein n=1 Tax=Pseudomonas sp. NBRC 111144 TaxID=1661059 RepID=UPI0006D3C58C|nr:hypothetical protein [Pseudomonas sp. NBRC 111144]